MKEKSLVQIADENDASPSMKKALALLDPWTRIQLAFKVIELTEEVVNLERKLEGRKAWTAQQIN